MKNGGRATCPHFFSNHHKVGDIVKNRRKKKKESGQAMVEFALVFPIFLLLVMGIIDFGFLFYNYISLENTARNVARIACVSYDKINYENYVKFDETFNFSDANYAEEFSDANMAADRQEENNANRFHLATKKRIVDAVNNSLPMGIDKSTVTVTINYTYDDMMGDNFKANDRNKGDVTVTVTGDARVLTPVLGVTADHMKKTLTSVSTFKVETQVTTDTTHFGG